MARELFLVQGSDEARSLLNKDVSIFTPVAPILLWQHPQMDNEWYHLHSSLTFPSDAIKNPEKSREETVTIREIRERELAEVIFVGGTRQVFSH